jgi:hypothetical protein
MPRILETATGHPENSKILKILILTKDHPAAILKILKSRKS